MRLACFVARGGLLTSVSVRAAGCRPGIFPVLRFVIVFEAIFELTLAIEGLLMESY